MSCVTGHIWCKFDAAMDKIEKLHEKGGCFPAAYSLPFRFSRYFLISALGFWFLSCSLFSESMVG